MSTVVINTPDEQDVEIPLGLKTLGAFRRWVFSKRFPERGRIDYIRGTIEVDMSPEDLFVHNVPKTEITSILYQLVKARQLGCVFSDRSRVFCQKARLSVEPDVVFVSQASIDSGVVTFRESKSKSHEGVLEIVGPPDVVVELISDSSVRKDAQDLRERYFAAGILEYWLFDCRDSDLHFDLYVRGTRRFEAVAIDRDGFRASEVFGASFRLKRKLLKNPVMEYTLEYR